MRAGTRFPWEKVLFACGAPFAPVYSLAMRIRAFCYKKNIFRRHRLPVPVISVGNISMGGTGKTPLVIALARHLLEQGYLPAVISRGYAGSFNGEAGVVSDGVTIYMNAARAGDEPRLLAQSLAGVPVVIGRRRLAAARLAITRFAPDVLILDDGFQHLALERDLDIVLFRADTPAGVGRVFPGGPLREPPAALLRADAFVVTGVPPDAVERPAIQQWLGMHHPQQPVFSGRTRPLHLVHPDGNSPVLPLTTLRERKVFVFCAIAAPDGFTGLVRRLGATVCGSAFFRDHRAYSHEDIARLTRQAKEAGAAFLLTTAKDMVKLPATDTGTIPVLALEICLDVEPAFFILTLARLASWPRGYR